MEIANRAGTRFSVIVQPARSVHAVPIPYASPEAFLSSFTPQQRGQILRGLGADPRFPAVACASLRHIHSDGQATTFLVGLVRARQLAFSRAGADPGARHRPGGSSGGGPASDAPPPPPPPPPRVQEAPTCELMLAEAACSHNGRKANRAGLLEVVPGRSDDLIRLTSQLRGGCGSHTRWEIRAPGASMVTKTGTEATFVARTWAFKTLWGVFEVVPKSYAVHASACSGAAKQLEVRAYPIDQWKILAEVDFKKPPLQWAWEVTLTTWEDLGGEDEGLKVKNNLLQALKDKKQQLDYALEKVLAPLVGPTTKWEFFKTKLFFTGRWAEHSDHRAFYKYEATLKLDPLIKGEFTLPFGPTAAIPPWIKRWATDYIGDLYLYLKISGEVSLQGRWGRSSPDAHEATVSGEGKVAVKVGGNLFLMKRGALNLDVNGGTFVSIEAKAPVARKPAVEYDLKWGGIEIELTIEAMWGTVEYKRKWKPVEGGSILEKVLGRKPAPWYPLGQ